MAAKSDYVTGTITLTNGSTAFTGTGTGWLLAGFAEGDEIKQVEGQTQWEAMVASVTDNTHGTLVRPWGGATGTYAYRLRYQADGQRVTAQARNLIELLGDGTLLSLAGLSGPGVIELLAGGGAQVVPRTSLVSGAAYDVQVANLAARAAYDGQAAGYAVLVANVGDGRAAIYSKASDASADWSAPAYVTGPVGPNAAVTVDTTTTLAPGSAATVVATPVTGGIELDFGIPAGEGFVSRGAYSGATAYAKGDVVLNNNSSWIAKVSTTGNAPPNLPTTSNTQWQLLAAKGTDGTGTGDVVGPAVAVDGQFAVADGATGKLIKFLTPAAATAALNAMVGDAGAGGTKGLVPAPASGDDAAAKFLRADGTWAPVALAELEMTVSQLALQVADNTNVALFLGPTGNRVADSFDALTYVDVAGATNLNTSVAGLLKPTTGADAFSTTVNPTLTTNASTFGGYSSRERIPAASLAFSGDRVRITLTPPTAGNNCPLDDVWIGHAGTGANFDGTQVRVTFNGGATGVTLPAGGASVLSDVITYAVDKTKDLIIALDYGTTADVRLSSAATGFTSYQKGATSGESGNTTVSGYSPNANFVELVDLVEVRTALGTPNNLTVRSASFTAAAAPAKAKALIRVKEVDAATAGTDYTLECSRDGGTTWSTMTLTELFTSPSPTAGIRVVEAAETSVSGQPSGTSPRWRFKTLNNKNVELHDALLYWS